MKIKNSELKILLILIVIGAFLRFYNLNWGAPFYFHPDERNIASLISSLNFLKIGFLLQGTFAYGNLISNILSLFKVLTAQILSSFGLHDSFSQSVILLRLTSSIISAVTIALVFFIAYKILDWRKAFLATFLTTFSVGLIQGAHFGVYESTLALTYLLVFFAVSNYIRLKRPIYLYLQVIIIGVSAAIKINSLVILIIPLALIGSLIRSKKIDKLGGAFYGLYLTIISLLITFLLSPYYLTEKFRDMLSYEASLLTGSLPVFYTGEFFNTTPVIYQLTQILPFLINPILALLFIPSLVFVFYQGLRKKNYIYLLLAIFFFVLLLPNAFLFAKWTRYLVPLLPFIYLIIATATIDLLDVLPNKLSFLKTGIIGIILLTSVLFGFFYLLTTFGKQDTRVAASKWASQNIPSDARVLSEVYDLGIVPFNTYFTNISVFNFYDLDNGLKGSELSNLLKDTDYIILPSQRILKSRFINKERFPNGFDFYSQLFLKKAGFKKIYETPCDIYCKITYLGDPVFSFEETTNVFDRPTVLIFKKN